jgi:hypothetical protein
MTLPSLFLVKLQECKSKELKRGFAVHFETALDLNN